MFINMAIIIITLAVRQGIIIITSSLFSSLPCFYKQYHHRHLFCDAVKYGITIIVSSLPCLYKQYHNHCHPCCDAVGTQIIVIMVIIIIIITSMYSNTPSLSSPLWAVLWENKPLSSTLFIFIIIIIMFLQTSSSSLSPSLRCHEETNHHHHHHSLLLLS